MEDYEFRQTTWNDPTNEVEAVRKVKTPRTKTAKSATSKVTSASVSTFDAASFITRTPSLNFPDELDDGEEQDNARFVPASLFVPEPQFVPGPVPHFTPAPQFVPVSRTRESRSGTAYDTVSGISTISFYTSKERPVFDTDGSIHSTSLSFHTSKDRPHARGSTFTAAESERSIISVDTSDQISKTRASGRGFDRSIDERSALSVQTGAFQARGRTLTRDIFTPAPNQPQRFSTSTQDVRYSGAKNHPNYYNYAGRKPVSTFDDLVDKYKRGGPSVIINKTQYGFRQPVPQNERDGTRAYTPSQLSTRHQGHSRGASIAQGYEYEASSRSVFNGPNLYNDHDLRGLGSEGYEGLDGFLRDNDADRAERAGFEPDGHFSLPYGRHRMFDERFFGPRNTNLRHIAVKTNTHLSMPADAEDPNILIWGAEDDVLLAKRDLMDLMDHINADIQDNINCAHPSAWVRVKKMPNARKMAHLEKLALESAIRKRFRKQPAEGQKFRAVGVFLWPSKEINPQFCLGMSFEALDDIRFHCQVYIVYSRAKSMFRILGQDPKGVNEAVDRVYGAYCEIASKNRKPNKRYLVRPPSMQLAGTGVRVVKRHVLEGRQITLKNCPKGVGIQVFLTGEIPTQAYLREWYYKRHYMQLANYRYLKEVFQEGLKDTFYYRGYSTLKIHYGTLLIFGYKKPKAGLFELKDFCDMMGNPQTSGEVVRYIGEDYVAKAIIEQCDARPDLFSPAEAKDTEIYRTTYNLTEPVPTAKTEAAYFATFEIKMYDDSGQTNDIRLEVKFELIPGDHPSDIANDVGEVWRIGTRRWLHVRNNPMGGARSRGTFSQHRGPIDVKVFDLERDMSWQIELVAYDYYRDTDIYPIFSEFVRKVSLEEIPDETDPIGPPLPLSPDLRRTVKRVKYVNLPGMSVESVILKTKYRYWINGTPYLFENTRYEYFDTFHVNHLYPDGISISWKGVRDFHDTRWSCCLINADVNDIFAKQKGLDVGCIADWSPEVDNVFKSSGIGGFEHPAWTRINSAEKSDLWQGDGFKEMLYRIEECGRFIAKIRDDILAKEFELEDDDYQNGNDGSRTSQSLDADADEDVGQSVNADDDEYLECLDLADV